MINHAEPYISDASRKSTDCPISCAIHSAPTAPETEAQALLHQHNATLILLSSFLMDEAAKYFNPAGNGIPISSPEALTASQAINSLRNQFSPESRLRMS